MKKRREESKFNLFGIARGDSKEYAENTLQEKGFSEFSNNVYESSDFPQCRLEINYSSNGSVSKLACSHRKGEDIEKNDSTIYSRGKELYDREEYSAAMQEFLKLPPDYEDRDRYINTICYSEGVALYEKGAYSDAMQRFKILPSDYEDSEKYVNIISEIQDEIGFKTWYYFSTYSDAQAKIALSEDEMEAYKGDEHAYTIISWENTTVGDGDTSYKMKLRTLRNGIVYWAELKTDKVTAPFMKPYTCRCLNLKSTENSTSQTYYVDSMGAVEALENAKKISDIANKYH